MTEMMLTCIISVVVSYNVIKKTLSNQTSLTYDVSHLISDSTRRSDEGIVTLIVFHLHLKEPFSKHRNIKTEFVNPVV